MGGSVLQAELLSNRRPSVEVHVVFIAGRWGHDLGENHVMWTRGSNHWEMT